MDIEEIKYWVLKFRKGTEKAFENDLFKEIPFSRFPNACCGDATHLLAQYLAENYDDDMRKYRYEFGEYRYDDFENIFQHAWLVFDNRIIVDITSDQKQFSNSKIFPQNAYVPCFVAESSEFHELFERVPLQCFEFYGIETMGEYSHTRLRRIYDTIIQNIV